VLIHIFIKKRAFKTNLPVINIDEFEQSSVADKLLWYQRHCDCVLVARRVEARVLIVQYGYMDEAMSSQSASMETGESQGGPAPSGGGKSSKTSGSVPADIFRKTSTTSTTTNKRDPFSQRKAPQEKSRRDDKRESPLDMPAVTPEPIKETVVPSISPKEAQGRPVKSFRLKDRDAAISDLEEHSLSDREVEDDSSNDDSSYFADPNNWTSPKSAGRRLFSSNASAPPQLPYHPSSHARESDASLSLSSDDSSMEHRPRAPVADLQAPQNMTRIHSARSLMSGSSNESTSLPPHHTPSPFGPPTPTGRLSPTFGHHAQPVGRMVPPVYDTLPPPPPPTNAHPLHLPCPQPYPYHPYVRGSMQSHTTHYSTESVLAYSEDGEGTMGRSSALVGGGGGDRGMKPSYSMGGDNPEESQQQQFRVYWQRWLMLMYMSVLNLLVSVSCLVCALIVTIPFIIFCFFILCSRIGLAIP
jgi:hypothetical protein